MHRDTVYAIARTVARKTDYFAVPHEGVTEDTWHVALYDHHGYLLGNLTEQDIKKAIVLRDAGIILDDLLDHTMSATPQGGRETGITVRLDDSQYIPTPNESLYSQQENYEQHAQGGVTPIPRRTAHPSVDIEELKRAEANPFESDDNLAGKPHR